MNGRLVVLYPCQRITTNGWPQLGPVHSVGNCQWCGDGRNKTGPDDVVDRTKRAIAHGNSDTLHMELLAEVEDLRAAIREARKPQ